MSLQQLIDTYVAELCRQARWAQAVAILNAATVPVNPWLRMNLTRTTHTEAQIEAVRISGVTHISPARSCGFPPITIASLQTFVRESMTQRDWSDTRQQLDGYVRDGRIGLAAAMRLAANRIEVEP